MLQCREHVLHDSCTQKNTPLHRVGTKIAILFLLTSLGVSFAQTSDPLLGETIRLEDVRDQAAEDIGKCDAGVQKCEGTISRSDRLAELARQAGATSEEERARQASSLARDAVRRLLESKRLAVSRRDRVEERLACLARNEKSLESASARGDVKSVVVACVGRVSVQTPDGRTMVLGEAGALVKGDTLVTGVASSAELGLLNGRGSIKVGELSRVKMEEDTEDAQVIGLTRGSINVSIQKTDGYLEMLERRIKACERDLAAAPDEAKEKLLAEYRALQVKWQTWVRRKFEVHYVDAIMTVRGTQFLAHQNERGETEVVVIEGTVELALKNGANNVLINAGCKGIVTKEGVVYGPEKTDVSNLERLE